MLRAAFGFFVLALVAITWAVSVGSPFAQEAGRALLVIFLILAVFSFIVGIAAGGGRR